MKMTEKSAFAASAPDNAVRILDSAARKNMPTQSTLLSANAPAAQSVYNSRLIATLRAAARSFYKHAFLQAV